MKFLKEPLKKVVEYVLPWAVLAILLFYTYAHFFQHSYGFWWGSPDGTISKVFVNAREPTIHVGDKLVQVGSLDLKTFNSHLRRTLFEGAKVGDQVPIVVNRNGQVFIVPWSFPGTNAGEIRDQLFGQWFLAYFFWIAGSLALWVLRPRDERWFLMAAFNFLTAIWLISGSGLSFFHIWYSALILRVAIWSSLPVYLHLHWVFPRPLGKLPRGLALGIYALGAGMAVLQWFELIPPGLYVAAFLLAIVGSLVLLLLHVARQPDMRRELGLIHIAAAIAFVPTMLLAIASTIRGSMPALADLALMSFPALPFAYLYAAYRRQLGGLELRVNRFITIYAFLVTLGLAIIPLLVAIDRLPVYWASQTLITSLLVGIVATALTLWAFPTFQRYVERRWLGISLPSKELQQTYSSHITTSNSFASLARLLNEEILPSMLVRQFVCVVLEKGSTRILMRNGVPEEDIPIRPLLVLLRPMAKLHPAPKVFEDPRYSWIRLTLTLKVEDDLLGFWLFGRRDPDDVYSSGEIPILQSFADRAAIAVSNILQTQRLRAMYQADINHHERERLSLARELHDSVLSELAGMLMNADMNALPRNFQDGYRALAERLRDIVSELRPPMLSYGLKPAIVELADNLMDRSKDTINIVVEIEPGDQRYPLEKEQHLFRIVQEACENAVRHSNGRNITICGRLESNRLELNVDDNGDGFEANPHRIELDDLLSQGHFGLAGMLERAELIDAEVRLTSTRGAGTQVRIRWTAPEMAATGDQGSGDFSS